MAAVACCTRAPASGEPVKVAKWMPGFDVSAAPASAPYPVTRLRAPGGSPASMASSAIRITLRHASSDGFSTAALPIASAGASVRPIICAG
ncbi:hypothetical protein D3C86_1823610 [compost metagenome]